MPLLGGDFFPLDSSSHSSLGLTVKSIDVYFVSSGSQNVRKSLDGINVYKFMIQDILTHQITFINLYSVATDRPFYLTNIFLVDLLEKFSQFHKRLRRELLHISLYFY